VTYVTLFKTSTELGAFPVSLEDGGTADARNVVKVKGKAIPLLAWTDPEGYRRLRPPHFKKFGP
jgi:hypothetical protein